MRAESPMPSSGDYATRSARHILGAIAFESPVTVEDAAALIRREHAKDADPYDAARAACQSVAHLGRPAVDALARHLGAIVSRCFGCGAVYRAVDPDGADCGVSDGLCSMKCGVPDDAITPLEDMQ